MHRAIAATHNRNADARRDACMCNACILAFVIHQIILFYFILLKQGIFVLVSDHRHLAVDKKCLKQHILCLKQTKT